MTTRPVGFTLAEVIVALVVFGIVATLLTRALVAGQRTHRDQLQQVALSESGRAAAAILPGALHELSAADGDLLGMDSSALAYNVMRAVYVQCAPPDSASRTVFVHAGPAFGTIPLDPSDDSLLLFAEGDPWSRADDAWLSAGASAVVAGTACPGGRRSLAITVTGLPAAGLAGVRAGAPVRTFRPAQVLAYPDAAGDWWLGQRLFQASSGSWSTVQPVLGPLATAGLAVTYLDRNGVPADSAPDVARIDLRVRSRSPLRVRRGAATAYLARDAATQVFLRNNPRY